MNSFMEKSKNTNKQKQNNNNNNKMQLQWPDNRIWWFGPKQWNTEKQMSTLNYYEMEFMRICVYWMWGTKKASSGRNQCSSFCRDEGKDDMKKEQLEGQQDNQQSIRTMPPRREGNLRCSKRSADKSSQKSPEKCPFYQPRSRDPGCIKSSDYDFITCL